MTESESHEQRIQAFLSNHAFMRSFEVFDTYQQLLLAHAHDEAKQQEIRDRMKLVFHRQQEGDEPISDMAREAGNIFDATFSLLEKGELTKEKLASIFSESLIAEQLLENWNPTPGATREKGKVMVNEVLEYFVGDKKNLVDINIVPTSVRGEEVWTKVFEGLKLLAQEIDHGSLQDIQTIRAQSWLFSSPFFKEKLQPFLGEDAILEDMPEDDGDVVQVQRLALTYHKGAMKTFLLEGKPPQVKRLQMDRKTFLEKFL